MRQECERTAYQILSFPHNTHLFPIQMHDQRHPDRLHKRTWTAHAKTVANNTTTHYQRKCRLMVVGSVCLRVVLQLHYSTLFGYQLSWEAFCQTPSSSDLHALGNKAKDKRSASRSPKPVALLRLMILLFQTSERRFSVGMESKSHDFDDPQWPR